ncbi:MAG: class I SAM-dependent methyltransferase [Spirosomataceae bacterium]
MARKESAFTRLLSSKMRNNVKESLQFFGNLFTPTLILNPSISGKYYAYNPSSNEFVVTGLDENSEKDKNGLPIPPKEIRIGETTAEEFVSSGKVDYDVMLKLLSDVNIASNSFGKILEFGCSSGRMIRFFHSDSFKKEIWGVDLASEHIYWCQQNLSPINFTTVTLQPHLPFEDNYFDFIYAGSVFTHIDDLAYTWFLELKRITKKGGIIYVTIHDENTIDYFNKHQEKIAFQKMILGTKAFKTFSSNNGKIFTVGRSMMSHVFYESSFIKQQLSKIFEIISYVPNSYREYQTGVILKKK